MHRFEDYFTYIRIVIENVLGLNGIILKRNLTDPIITYIHLMSYVLINVKFII